MVGCYFNAHRPQDGQWLPADCLPKSPTGQPIAYVAKGAHGLYNSVSLFVASHQMPAKACRQASHKQSSCCLMLAADVHM